jgi:hypothetical protein
MVGVYNKGFYTILKKRGWEGANCFLLVQGSQGNFVTLRIVYECH